MILPFQTQPWRSIPILKICILRVFSILFLILLLSQEAWALLPMQGYHDLVAGEGTAGLQNGPFYDALFHTPKGLALSSDGTHLYVADQDNNCIRVIDLENRNQVSTLVGTAKSGYTDGSFDIATFNKPNSLIFLPNQCIAVWDAGNTRIRLIDINRKIVSTLAGDGTIGIRDGYGNQAQVGAIWNMAYLPSQDSLYFSQPDSETLRKVDLKTRQVSTVFTSVSGQLLPHPGALCVAEGNLYIADRQEAQVYQLKPKKSSPAIGREAFDWNLISNDAKILALTWSDKSLYGLRNDLTNPVARLWPNPHPVAFISPWSADPTQSTQNLSFFSDLYYPANFSLIADPLSDRKFYITHPSLNIVASFRDLSFNELKDNESYNSGGLMDFDYPFIKPPKTYRILIVGDSHLYHNYHAVTDTQNRMELTAKRLELMLNTEAALDDVPLHFEVLTQARPSSEGLNRWTYYEVPPSVRKYDIDLVLLELLTNFSLEDYYQRPLTKEEIPVDQWDAEFLTTRWPKKSNSDVAEKFLDLCLTNHLASTYGNGQPAFSDFSLLIQHEDIRNSMVKMFSRPLKLLNQYLNSMKTHSGHPVRMEVCLMPYAQLNGNFRNSPFWKDVLNEIGAPFMDFSPLITTFRISYSPFAEPGGASHFDANGHLLISYLLGHNLIQNKVIPWK